MRKLHYAWAICLGGALTMFVIIGFGINIFSVFQPYIITQNGFTNAQGSFITTIRSFFVLGSIFTANYLCDKIGLRRMLIFAYALMVLSCVYFGFAKSYFDYCAAAVLTGLAYGYGGMIPLSIMVGRWFTSRRGFALGLASAGSGIPTIFAPGIITKLIESKGLRYAFLAEAAFIFVIVVIAALLIRSYPYEMGLTPYYLESGDNKANKSAFSSSKTLSKPLSLLLLFAAFLIGAPGGPGFSHITVLYSSSGYSGVTVAKFISFLGIMICAGKVFSGQIYDTLGSFKGNFYIFTMLFLSMTVFCMAPLKNAMLPYVAMVLFGFGVAVSNISFAVWARDLYGDEGYERATRAFTTSYSLGMLLFGPLPGIWADMWGSYVYSYMFFAATVLVSAVIIQFAYYAKNR